MSRAQADALGSQQTTAPARAVQWSRRRRRGVDDGHDRDRLDALADALQQPLPPRRQVGVGTRQVPIPRPGRLMLRIRMEGAVLALPTVRFELGGSAGGRCIAESMLSSCGGRTAWDLRGRSVYAVPVDGQPYQGRRAHSRRNAVNRVKAAGIRIETVPPDRLSADAALHTLGVCPAAPGCGGLTIVALDRDGEVDLLAMSHAHVDGTVAELRQAVHAADNPLTDPVRYAMFAAVVKELAANDVHLVVDFANYLRSPKGRRTYQQVLGYRPVNLRVRLTT